MNHFPTVFKHEKSTYHSQADELRYIEKVGIKVTAKK